jgi:site-specific DNA-methyltransferase (cytosine-N4-specific)
MLWETYQKRRSDLPPMTSKFIDDLAKDYHSDKVGFRRRNLPALLASYFLDMRDSMESARKMMKPGSYGFWVVGNNSTNVDGERVEICTDKYLWEIGKKVGWMQEGIIDMELLPSRDIFRNNRGTAERILIFRSSPPRSAVYSDVNSKQHVNGSDWDFHGENTQQHLHALHPYPARFIPQIPRKAILDYTKRGDLVLDPFCGCGTTLLESSLLGRRSIGVDNNAVAALITQAKIATYRKKDLAVLKQFADKFTGSVSRLTKSSSVPEYDSINYWFDENAISDFGKIRYIVNKLPQPARTFALAVFSSLIVRFSYQDSDTRYCRIERKYKPGSAIKAFQTKILDNVNRLSEIINKEKAEAHVHLGDTRDLSFISPSSVSLIITSPPYLNAYDYHKYHRHRLHWIDGDIAYARDNEIGKHDTFTRPKATPDRYFREMEQSFMQWRRALKPGGKVLIVIGDSIVSGRPVTVADEFIKIMKSLHFVLESRWTRNLQTTKKSFNQKARIDQEHVLLFIKSD